VSIVSLLRIFFCIALFPYENKSKFQQFRLFSPTTRVTRLTLQLGSVYILSRVEIRNKENLILISEIVTPSWIKLWIRISVFVGETVNCKIGCIVFWMNSLLNLVKVLHYIPIAASQIFRISWNLLGLLFCKPATICQSEITCLHGGRSWTKSVGPGHEVSLPLKDCIYGRC
jgi:hypothetical protein